MGSVRCGSPCSRAALAAAVLAFLGASGSGASEPTDATVCELLEHPLRFANRRVRVQAKIRQAPEFFGLTYVECSTGVQGSEIWLERWGDRETAAFHRGWTADRFLQAANAGVFSGDGSSIPWEVPLAVTPPDDEELDALYRALAESEGQVVDAVVTGRFDTASGGMVVRSPDGRVSFQLRFGHLNCCDAQIALEHVELLTAGE